MTTDPRAWLESHAAELREYDDSPWFILNHRHAMKAADALLALLDMHKPLEASPGVWWCRQCFNSDYPDDSVYPCPTVRAFADRLGGK